MARPLAYTPEPVPTDTAHDELERLLETLHEAGVLRVLNGFFGRLAGVTEVALDQLDTPAGRDALANGVLLARALTQIDPDALERFLGATERGLHAAGEALAEDPPGVVGLAGALRDEDVRRGLYAVLAFTRALGAASRSDGEKG